MDGMTNLKTLAMTTNSILSLNKKRLINCKNLLKNLKIKIGGGLLEIN
jgi:hypothetical protein